MLADQLTLGEVAQIAGADLEGDPRLTFRALALLERAGPGDLTVFDGRQDASLLETTSAVAVIVPPWIGRARPGQNILRAAAPALAFRTIACALWRLNAFPPASIHATACIDASAILGHDISVGSHAIVGPRAQIGDAVALHARAVVSSDAWIGPRTFIGAGAFIGSAVRIGADCAIHPGAVVGFTNAARAGSEQPPCFAGVAVEDGAEIGPNCTVEMGEARPTRIGSGAHVGALSAIGHDAQIGKGARLVAMAGVAGEAEVGDYALLFGQVGVSSRSHVGESAVVMAKSGVARHVPPHAVFSGIPARPRDDWRESMAALHVLPRLLERWTKALELIEHRTGHGEHCTRHGIAVNKQTNPIGSLFVAYRRWRQRG